MARQEVQGRKAKSGKEAPQKSPSKRGNGEKFKEAKAIADAIMGLNTSLGKFTALYPAATMGDMASFCLINQSLWEKHLNQRLWDNHRRENGNV